MSKRVLIALLGVLALAALVAGCGGGDDSDSSGGTSSSSEALTKPAFIKAADAICAKGEAAVEDEVEEFAEDNDVNTDEPSKADQEEVIASVVAPGVAKQVEEIDELSAPEGDEEAIEEIVSSVEDGTAELEDDPSLLFEGKSPLADGSKLAREYGLSECGEE